MWEHPQGFTALTNTTPTVSSMDALAQTGLNTLGQTFYYYGTNKLIIIQGYQMWSFVDCTI